MMEFGEESMPYNSNTLLVFIFNCWFIRVEKVEQNENFCIAKVTFY